MCRILALSLVLFVAGCATATRPVAETPVRELPPQTAPATKTPVPVPVPPVEQQSPDPVSPPPVVRKRLGLEEFAEANDEMLLYVYPGMTRQVVEQIMDGHQSGKWVNPYKHQTITYADGSSHEVLFYLTRAPRPGQRVTENFLTPVILQNNRVDAIGRYPLKKVRRAACQSRATGPCS